MRTVSAAPSARAGGGDAWRPVELELRLPGRLGESVVHGADAVRGGPSAGTDLGMDLQRQLDEGRSGLSQDPIAVLRDVAEGADEVEPVPDGHERLRRPRSPAVGGTASAARW